MLYKEKADAVRNRINNVLKGKGLTENSVAAGVSAVQSRLNSQLSHGGKISLDTILRILDACPDISADWLLRGRGEMVLNSTPVVNSNNVNSKVNSDNNTLSENFVRTMLEQKDKEINRLLTLLEKK